jgi:hypothetical protein
MSGVDFVALSRLSTLEPLAQALRNAGIKIAAPSEPAGPQYDRLVMLGQIIHAHAHGLGLSPNELAVALAHHLGVISGAHSVRPGVVGFAALDAVTLAARDHAKATAELVTDV